MSLLSACNIPFPSGHIRQQATTTELGNMISARTATVAVIGLGYVGLPLAMASAVAGFQTIGLDVDPDKVSILNDGESYIDAVTAPVLSEQLQQGRFKPTCDYGTLADADIIIICVPTPLSRNREPDLRFIERTAEAIAAQLRPGHLVVLESTTYPGTTEDVLVPILERSGLKCGKDFYVGFSPEREDPGNADFHTRSIPKIVSGLGAEAAELVESFYSNVVEHTVCVSSPATAEAVKITENVFRAVNVALVNELKVIFDGYRCLGNHRCCCDQALWFHALLPGAGSWWALHSDRPVLPHMARTRIWCGDAVYRAGWRNKPCHALLCHGEAGGSAGPHDRQIAGVVPRAGFGRRL
jgi:nucleotide sugar dehydrogenase